MCLCGPERLKSTVMGSCATVRRGADLLLSCGKQKVLKSLCTRRQIKCQHMTQPFSLVWLPPTAFSFMYIKSLCTLGLRANGATIPYALPSLHFLLLKDFLWSTSQYCTDTLQCRSGLISSGSLAMVNRV